MEGRSTTAHSLPSSSRPSENRRSLLPQYARIADALQQRMQIGTYQTGGFLPSEHALSKEFGVSRGTVRQAIDLLRDRGFLQAEVGRGTRVLSPQSRSLVFQLADFNDEVRRSGSVPSTKLLRREVVAAGVEVAERLRIRPRSKVIRMVRLRLADGVPLVHETRILAVSMCPELLEEDVEHQSVHDLMLNRYHIPLVRMELSIVCVPLPPEVAAPLGVPAENISFFLDRVTYRHDDVPVSWFRAYYRGDHFDLTVHH
jgi:GntR family transcriptional regulator